MKTGHFGRCYEFRVGVSNVEKMTQRGAAWKEVDSGLARKLFLM
jgi:hypothetical protein